MEIKTNFYTLIPFENVLYIESYESWDERVVTDFAGHVKQVALQNYKKKAWAILHDGREWKLGTPTIESMVTKLMNTPVTNTITHHAFVTGPSEIKKWQIGKIFKNVTGYQIEVFENPTDAEEWLSSFGYTKAVIFQGGPLCPKKKSIGKIKKIEKDHRFLSENLIDAIWLVDAKSFNFEIWSPISKEANASIGGRQK